jgi:rhodanese-related sulfurtransferase
MEEITVEEFYPIFQDMHEDDICIDIREIHEWGADSIDGFRHIPLVELPKHLPELKQKDVIYVLCQSGKRSAKVCDFLMQSKCHEAINIKGGIEAWRAHFA